MELEYISYALLKLQSFYGAFPVISSFGGKSDAVLKLISRLKNTIVSGVWSPTLSDPRSRTTPVRSPSAFSSTAQSITSPPC